MAAKKSGGVIGVKKSKSVSSEKPKTGEKQRKGDGGIAGVASLWHLAANSGVKIWRASAAAISVASAGNGSGHHRQAWTWNGSGISETYVRAPASSRRSNS
jgi:hypothetical protein